MKFEDSTVDARHAEAMRSALKEVASSSGKNSQLSGDWTSSDDDADTMDQDSGDSEAEMSGRNFRERRQVHYDEFQKVKELQRKGSLLEDASDDDDNEDDYEDEDDEKDGKSDSSSSLTAGVKDIDIEGSSNVHQPPSAPPADGA